MKEDWDLDERKSTFDNPDDVAALLDCIEAGDNKKQMVRKTGMSMSTLNKQIKVLQEEKGVLTHYRGVQSLQLTKLQAKVLGAMDDEDKIDRCNLVELASVFNILKKNELTLDGKPSEIKGLVSYLVEIEKEDDEAAKALPVDGSIIDVSEEDVAEEVMPVL